MWTWSQIVDLIGQHPGEAIAMLLLVLMASFIAAGVFLAWWADREEQARPKAAGVKHRRIS